MNKEVMPVEFEEEFRICPVCGYEDGFHTMLKRDGDRVKWLFICPSCHKIFDVGYETDPF